MLGYPDIEVETTVLTDGALIHDVLIHQDHKTMRLECRSEQEAYTLTELLKNTIVDAQIT